jgi:hypothetical protein
LSARYALTGFALSKVALFVAPQRLTELLPRSRLVKRWPGKSLTAES